MNEKPVNIISEVTIFPKPLPGILNLPILGERPSLDFVNTIDWRLDPERSRDTLTFYSDLLAFVLRLNLVSIETYTELSERSAAAPSTAERSIADARAFRDALTSLIDTVAARPEKNQPGQPKPDALAIIDAARRRAHESESLVWNYDRLTLLPQPEEEGFDLPWLLLVRDAEELLRSPQASRIRICAAEGCGWVFVDTSKNGTRRWCSMKLCGNREKAARFKARANMK